METFEESITRLKLAVAIQTTQMLLQQRQREADELEQRWINLKSQCASLAEELQAYTLRQSQLIGQNQVTRPRRRTFALNLPEELLCEIFEYATYRCHPSIRSLLLVCKHFHRVIMGASSLWMRVDIIFDQDLMKCFHPTKGYVEACMERSRGRLLDITIKHPQKSSSTEYTLESIVREIIPLVGEDEAHRLRSTLSGAEWEFENPLLQERIAHINEVVDSLVGFNGEHLSRWGSLSITLPEELWGCLHLSYLEEYSAPNLERLQIMKLEFTDDWIHEHDMLLGEMPRLRSLKMDRLSLHWFDPLPTSITHLDTMYGNGAIFNHLPALQHLHHLSIREANSYTFAANSNDPVTLSNLFELHIYGHVNRIFAMLVTPRLEVLCVWSSETTITLPLPVVSSIEWIYDGKLVVEAPDTPQDNALSSILRKLTRTDRISFRGFPPEMVDETTNKLKRAGEISTSLRTVEVIIDDATRRTVCNWTL